MTATGRLAAVVFVLLCATPDLARAQAQQLLVCGWDEVYLLDVSATPRKTWSWRATSRPELPGAFRTKFRTTDECKPVAGNRVLVTASSDGAALIDRATGVATWWGACGNAHSADLLPADRVVLACSVREGTGNRLVVFDAAVPERELFTTELHSGHGAVWDAQRQVLWALGMDEVRAYALVAWDTPQPSLALQARYRLPDAGGHELSAVPGSPMLMVSTHASVWRFDRDAGTFTAYPALAGLHDVKSITVHPVTGRVAYVQADAPEWWSRHIRLLQPAGLVTLDDERIYKVRWVE